jgi:hypothetical protein
MFSGDGHSKAAATKDAEASAAETKNVVVNIQTPPKIRKF